MGPFKLETNGPPKLKRALGNFVKISKGMKLRNLGRPVKDIGPP